MVVLPTDNSTLKHTRPLRALAFPASLAFPSQSFLHHMIMQHLVSLSSLLILSTHSTTITTVPALQPECGTSDVFPTPQLQTKDSRSSTQPLLDAIKHHLQTRSLTTKYVETALSLLLLFQKGTPSTPIVNSGIDGIWAPVSLIGVK